jgi:hypothetical protein
MVPQELLLHLQLLAIDEEWLRLFWKGIWSPLYGMAPVVGDSDEEQQQQELQNSSVVAAVWLLLPSRFLCSEIEGLTVYTSSSFEIPLALEECLAASFLPLLQVNLLHLLRACEEFGFPLSAHLLLAHTWSQLQQCLYAHCMDLSVSGGV